MNSVKPIPFNNVYSSSASFDTVEEEVMFLTRNTSINHCCLTGTSLDEHMEQDNLFLSDQK